MAGEVSGHVVVLVLLEGVVAGVAPEDGGHAEFVSLLEGVGDFDDLAVGLGGAEVDRRTDGGAAHVGGLLQGAVHHLVTDVGVGEQLVVVDLHHERNLVRVAAGDAAEDAEGGADRVATAFDGELHDVLTVEVDRVLGEGGAGGVFDALVDREDRDVARVGEAAGAVEALQVGQDAVVAIRGGEGVVDPIRARGVDLLLLDLRVVEPEEVFGFGAEVLLDFAVVAHGAGKVGVFQVNRPPQKGETQCGLQAIIQKPP